MKKTTFDVFVILWMELDIILDFNFTQFEKYVITKLKTFLFSNKDNQNSTPAWKISLMGL